MSNLESWFSLSTLLWLFPAVFMVHDLEEIITVESCMKRIASLQLRRVPKLLAPMVTRLTGITTAQFAAAVLLEFIVFLPITYVAAEKGIYYLFLSCNTIMFLHVFTHLGQSILLGRYTPGVITSVLVITPYSLVLFYRLLDQRIVSIGEVLWSIPAGLLVVPLVMSGFRLGKLLAPGKEPGGVSR
jgi:hypothetical protein